MLFILTPALSLKGEGARFPRKRESSDGASFDKLRTNDSYPC